MEHASHVPVEDAADERRDEGGADRRGGNGLGETEQQRHVAVDALGLQDLRGLAALPGGRQLDEHAVMGHASCLVHLDDAARTLDAVLRVEAARRG